MESYLKEDVGNTLPFASQPPVTDPQPSTPSISICLALNSNKQSTCAHQEYWLSQKTMNEYKIIQALPPVLAWIP